MDEIPEMRDWKEYSKHCRGIGYTLIPRIRRDHPGTAIIGTSSSSDLSHYSNPDHNLSKIDFDLAESLEKLLVEMQN